MRSIISRRGIIFLIALYLTVGLVFLLKLPNGLTVKEMTSYLFVLASYFIVGFIWIVQIDKHGFFIFEPATMVIGLTFITFSVEPMISVIQGDLGIGSFYVFDGCKKATIIYMIAILIFMFGYYNGSNFMEQKEDDGTIYQNDRIQHLALVIWCGAFILQVVDLISNGYSLNYIFSLGSSGALENVEDGGLGIFGNIRYFMVTALLYLDVYSKNKKSVWILRMLSVLLSVLRGYRWIVVIYILSPIVLYAYMKRKSPKMKTIIVLICTLAIIIGAMQFVRTSLREGNGIGNYNEEAQFNLAYIWGAFQGNFDLYKSLYGAVTYFPEQQFYTMGQQMILLTIATIIPRSIWPSKPYSVIDTVYKPHFMGNDAVRGHWAYAQISEFYIEFGVTGVIICMYLFGRFCKFLRELPLYENRTVHDVVVASFFFPMLMQLVIRGYMPLNFWPIIFILIPVFFMKYAVSYNEPI